MKIDFAQVKQDFPIRDVVFNLIGDHLYKHGHYADDYRCPFHHDGNASFRVNDDTCVCFAGCQINGGSYGDVLDFVKELYNLRSTREAALHLIQNMTSMAQMVQPTSKPEPPPRIGWNDVYRGTKYQKEALPYFNGRNITTPTVGRHKMGKYIDWGNRVGETIYRSKRFTIPDIAYGTVRNIELRLDEEDARLQLEKIDKGILRDAEAITGSERAMLYYFYGPKYLRVPGGVRKNLIFNVEKYMYQITHDGKRGWFSPRLPWLLVHEGALKALAVDDAGYPSIGSKGAHGLMALFGVEELIFVQDNEPDKQKKDGTWFNPGREYALKNLEMSGRKLGVNARIILPPDGYKGGDDAVKAGIIHDWLKTHGLERTAS